MNPIRSFAVLLCAAALAGCEKNAVQDITAPLPAARIRFFNFGVNSPSVVFFADDTKLTAVAPVSGAESTAGTAFNGVSSGGLYTGIEPGQYVFSGRLTAPIDSTFKKGHAVSTVPGTIEAGKTYSYFQSGIFNATTKTVDGFIVEDPIPATFDYTVAHVRFVNAISNAPPLTLYAKEQTSLIEVTVGSDVAYKSASAFMTVPNGTYDLRVRTPGGTTDAIVRTAVGFVAGRVYTITAKGDMTVTLATSANRPLLDNTLNR